MILEVVKNDFSEKLQLIRKNRGLTLEELAEKLSVSRQAVAKWKSGQVYPEITNLIQISNLLDAGSVLHDTALVFSRSFPEIQR